MSRFRPSRLTRRALLEQALRMGASTPALRALLRLTPGPLALSLAGCADPRSPEELATTIIYALERDVNTLDPCYSIMAVDGAVIATMHDTLTIFDENLKLGPNLATHWETPDGARTWIFHLRTDVHFHDGTPFNAQAVKFHMDRIADPAVKSNRITRVRLLEGTDVLDDHTVRFRMKQPLSAWPEQLRDPWSNIVSPKQVEALGHEGYATHPIGTGPFKFVAKVPDSHIDLVRNPDYWNGPVSFENLRFKTIKESTTRLIMLEKGQVDIGSIFFAHAEAAERSGKIAISSEQMLRIRYIGFNNLKPPFKDQRVRQACNYAIDREGLAKYAFRGSVDPAYGPIPPILPAYNHDMLRYDYNPDKARALLKEAGLDLPLTVDFWAMDTTADKACAETVSAQLREVGIRTNIKQFDQQVYWNRFDAYQTNEGKWFPTREGVFDLFIGGWSGGESPFGFLNPLFKSDSSSNSSFYKSDEVDRLLLEVYETVDADARDVLYRKLQAQIVEDAPWIFAYYSRLINGVNHRIAGYKTHPADEYQFFGVTIRQQEGLI